MLFERLELTMPRNAILITVDCLRYDRLSVADYDRPVSPHMDTFAEAGAFCDEAIATGPATRTSFPGILCSTYPLMYGGYAQLTGARKTVSEEFRDRGYWTVGVNTNTQLHSRFGWDRGFDVYYDSERTIVNDSTIDFDIDDGKGPSRTEALIESGKEKVYAKLDQDGFTYRLIESVYRRLSSRSAPYDSAATAVDRTFDYLDVLSDEKPLFLWVHFMEPHSPYVPPKSYREQFLDKPLSDSEMWRLNDKMNTNEDEVTDHEVSLISDLYDASVREVDDQIGRLIDGLRDRGYWDDSIAVLCGDHGEEFREHGGLAHGGRPYDELIRVPLIVKRSDEDIAFPDGITSTLDIAPTLLDTTDENATIPENFHGISLDPIIRGEEPIPDDRFIFSQMASGNGRSVDLSNRITACRTRSWKYLTSVHTEESDELYDITADPYEQDECKENHPDVVHRMRNVVENHYAQEAYERYTIEDAVESAHLENQLEALGYVQ